MGARIENLVTSGTFSLDGGTWDVDNNVWIVGDDTEVIVIDPAHDVRAITDAVAGRKVQKVLLTHGHDDHIRHARQFADLVGAPLLLHRDDLMLWRDVYPDSDPDGELVDGQEFTVAGTALVVRHTPGHSPGSVSLYAEELATVFTGDTLFAGGPGATGRSYSSFETIIESITAHLLTLPEETTVHTGHGDSTTIGAEAPHLQEWIDRGH